MKCGGLLSQKLRAECVAASCISIQLLPQSALTDWLPNTESLRSPHSASRALYLKSSFHTSVSFLQKEIIKIQREVCKWNTCKAPRLCTNQSMSFEMSSRLKKKKTAAAEDADHKPGWDVSMLPQDKSKDVMITCVWTQELFSVVTEVHFCSRNSFLLLRLFYISVFVQFHFAATEKLLLVCSKKMIQFHLD